MKAPALGAGARGLRGLFCFFLRGLLRLFDVEHQGHPLVGLVVLCGVAPHANVHQRRVDDRVGEVLLQKGAADVRLDDHLKSRA
ncbi:hypothetical protein M885DRAFT_145264 [Pelagophyceae sp. CCMP2097]|nr:hypothetical protein M885DRAFT_145264 [Pelagophyceae sp. CCMP2097]